MASGRIVDEFALYLVYLACGNDPAVFHFLVHLQSQDFATYTVLARLYLDANQHEKALAAYVHFVHGDWRAVAGSDYVRAGIDLQALSAGDMATEAYRHALERDSGDAAARINLGWLLYELGDYDKAIEQYEHILAREANATAQFSLGRARAAYEEGVELFGAQAAVAHWRGRRCARTRRAQYRGGGVVASTLASLSVANAGSLRARGNA